MDNNESKKHFLDVLNAYSKILKKELASVGSQSVTIRCYNSGRIEYDIWETLEMIEVAERELLMYGILPREDGFPDTEEIQEFIAGRPQKIADELVNLYARIIEKKSIYVPHFKKMVTSMANEVNPRTEKKVLKIIKKRRDLKPERKRQLIEEIKKITCEIRLAEREKEIEEEQEEWG